MAFKKITGAWSGVDSNGDNKITLTLKREELELIMSQLKTTTNRKGETFDSVKLFLFNNSYKEKESQPDYNLFIPGEDDPDAPKTKALRPAAKPSSRKKEEPIAEEYDAVEDDVPF